MAMYIKNSNFLEILKWHILYMTFSNVFELQQIFNEMDHGC